MFLVAIFFVQNVALLGFFLLGVTRSGFFGGLEHSAAIWHSSKAGVIGLFWLEFDGRRVGDTM